MKGRAWLGTLKRLAMAGALAAPLLAGPPFLTDDPEPVELDHLELYVFGANSGWGYSRTGSGPAVEFNYGILPQTQFHIIVPEANSTQEGMPGRSGLGDIELGVKYRFLEETESRPQIGVFPLIEVPTGNASRGLGAGHTQIFLPVWIQKGWGPWTTYGGYGWWRNPGPDQRNWSYAGWLLQRDLSKTLTLGGEVFRTTAATLSDPASAGFNLGGMVNFSERHHLLFSCGRNITGTRQTYAYVAYQLTVSAPRGLQALLGRHPHG